MTSIEKIRSTLIQDDTVLFIGSGISLWSGLPSWLGLLEELVHFIEAQGMDGSLVAAEARRGDLLQAASYGLDLLSKPQFGQFIRTAARLGKAIPHEIHHLIVTLGPSCYITTNYDDLIELSLRKYRPDVYFTSPVTNRHLSELADIVHARAKDFIFKPHGDAADIDSIVLTREQYRRLLPQGDRFSALESLKILMSTRPVVYLGFGLRDPDFMFIRDLLANTYNGGIRDHYAIMADVLPAEADYWRKNYGIHILSYDTVPHLRGDRVHTRLLAVLRELQPTVPELRSKLIPQISGAEIALSLARYAAGLARFTSVESEFEILVRAKDKQLSDDNIGRYDYLPVDQFLIKGPARALLVGYPGAGKSYALRKAAALLARKLQEATLSERFNDIEVIIPIFVDFKLYRGSIIDLISQALPPNLSFDLLSKTYQLKIYADSFNEMPREFWENGSYEDDFTLFFENYLEVQIVIGSRTPDGLLKLNYPVFFLDEIDRETLLKVLATKGINIKGRFTNDIYRLLERPFYLQYILTGRVTLSQQSHPKEFYEGFFADAQRAFLDQFNCTLEIAPLLAEIAYLTLNNGEEVFQRNDLLSILTRSINRLSNCDIIAEDVLNWLVSYDILVPYRGGRLAFVHQSITEYLAGTELAVRYLADPEVLRQKLTLTRWDQALFMALNILPQHNASRFLNSLLKVDLALALNASKYLEFDQEVIAEKLLQAVLDLKDSYYGDYWNLASPIKYSVPITAKHEPLLRALLNSDESLATAAAERLIGLFGVILKDEMLKLLFERPDDFNFGSDIGNKLSKYYESADLETIRNWCDNLDVLQNDVTDNSGFIHGIAAYLDNANLHGTCDALLDNKPLKTGSINLQIISQILWRKSTNEALQIAADILLKGIDDTVIAVSFMLDNDDGDNDFSPDMSIFNKAHIDQLLELFILKKDEPILISLREICFSRTDLRDYLLTELHDVNFAAGLAIEYAIGAADPTKIFNFFTRILSMTEQELALQKLNFLSGIYLDWEHHTTLFFDLLRLRNVQIVHLITHAIFPYDVKNLGKGTLKDIHWWLDWMLELQAEEDYGWTMMKVGLILGKYTDRATQLAFLKIFNEGDGLYKEVLSQHILTHISDLTTNDFSDSAIEFLLAKLKVKDYMKGRSRNLITDCATELFIQEYVLPLCRTEEKDLSNNILRLLTAVGKRHGRRYILNE